MKHDGLVSRRTFLSGLGLTATACLLPSMPSALAKGAVMEIEARAGKAELFGQGLGATDIWGYGGSVPGPVVRVKQHEEVRVDFKNSLEQPSTMHWHGIRIDNKMDGVAGLTQKAVAPGEVFKYRFKAPDAGTYWYHPHNRTWEQMARGLYGLLIVDEPEPIAVDHDVAVALDDWQLKRDGQLEVESFGNIGERAHSGRTGNTLTVNGAPNMVMKVKSGERARIRLANTANSRILNLFVQGGQAQIVALDGQPVTPFAPPRDLVILAPSQRADIVIDFDDKPGSRYVISEISEMRAPLIDFVSHDTEVARKKPLEQSVVLPSNNIPKPDMSNMLKVTLDMTGGAMGRMEKATVKGQELSVNDLVQKHGFIWAFNGVAGMPEKPLFSAKRGQTVELTMINNTAWPHAIHSHGHHMLEAVRKNPRPRRADIFASPNMWRDTVLMDVGETVTVVFQADNPGKWMLHCHMLEHQAGGMMSWFEVV